MLFGTKEKAMKTPRVIVRFNKVNSLTVFSRGKKVQKFVGMFRYRDVDNFLTGWFGTSDKKLWDVKYI